MPFNNLDLYSFIVVILLMLVTPGANQVLVLQSGLVIGHRAAIFNVLGVASSMFIHACLSGLGLSFIIIQSPALYSLIKLLGSAYIAYLAVNSLASAYRLKKQPPEVDEIAASIEQTAETTGKSFTKGFATNMLNIQTSFIFLSIFPQYMDRQQNLFIQSLLLTIVFVLLLLGWYSLIITLIYKVRNHLLNPRVQMKIKAVTGSLLLVMSIRMLFK